MHAAGGSVMLQIQRGVGCIDHDIGRLACARFTSQTVCHDDVFEHSTTCSREHIYLRSTPIAVPEVYMPHSHLCSIGNLRCHTFVNLQISMKERKYLNVS